MKVGLDPDDCAPYLLHLLGVPGGTETLADLSPEAVKTRTFDTLLQMSLRGVVGVPLVFVIEDLHWVDRTSEEFLASLADSLGPESMMLLATYRPGYQPPWTGRSSTTQLHCPGSPPATAGSSCGCCSRPNSRTRPRSSCGGARGTPSSSKSSRGSSRGATQPGPPSSPIRSRAC